MKTDQHKFTIVETESRKCIFSFENDFCEEDQDITTIDPDKLVLFAKYTEINYAICFTTDGIFPNFAIVNLDNGSVKLVNPMMKTMPTHKWVSEKLGLILVRGYLYGMIWTHLLFDFDGNEVDLFRCEDGDDKSEIEENTTVFPKTDFRGFFRVGFGHIQFHSHYKRGLRRTRKALEASRTTSRPKDRRQSFRAQNYAK